jgi:hypothetical protein
MDIVRWMRQPMPAIPAQGRLRSSLGYRMDSRSLWAAYEILPQKNFFKERKGKEKKWEL